jgi:hypothetical protein
MPIITYPLNGVEYDAHDAETYLCTRTSGVFSSDNNFELSITGGRQITISGGLAWINNGEYTGKSVVSTSPTVLDIPVADGVLNRIDLVVIRFDASANATSIVIKSGTPASSPVAPAVSRTPELYELGLYLISVPAGSTSVYIGDITSVILDENYCGVMRDAVTGIPTAQLQAQAMALIDQLKAQLGQAGGDKAEILVVSLTDNGDGTYISSHNVTEIREAISAGKQAFLMAGANIYTATFVGDTYVYFDRPIKGGITRCTVKGSTATIAPSVIDTVKNPFALSINGTTYDGSAAVNVGEIELVGTDESGNTHKFYVVGRAGG